MPCHALQRPCTRKIRGFSHLALVWGAGEVSVQGETSSSCSQARADQLCTVTQIWSLQRESAGTTNTAAGYLPLEVLLAQMLVYLVLLLALQDLLVSTRQAVVWPIWNLISPTVGSCHFPTAQGITEEEQGEPSSRLVRALRTQSRPL